MLVSLKRWKVGVKSMAVLSLAATITYYVPALRKHVDQTEQLTLDKRYQNFNRSAKPNSNVLIVDFDEDSILKYGSSYGRWPWSRQAYKDILQFISAGEPSLILFDILFSEPQLDDPQKDIQLGEISQQIGRISHAVQGVPKQGNNDAEIEPFPNDRAFPGPLLWKIQPQQWFQENQYHALVRPTQNLWQRTPNIHIVNAEPDSDGLFRRIPLIAKYQSEWIPSLTLRATLSKSAHEKSKLLLNGNQFEISHQDQNVDFKIPLDPQGNLTLHFYQNTGDFNALEVSAILDAARDIEANTATEKTLSPDIFKDKIVILGTSATGLNDLKVTPVGSKFPGVFLHATAISNILNNDYLVEVPEHLNLTLSLVLIFLCYFSTFFIEAFFIRNFLPPLVLFLLTFCAIYLFKNSSIHLPMAMPLIFGGFAMVHGYLHMAIIEARQRRQMQGTLSKYLSPTVTQHLIDSGINPTAEVGHWKEISILFSDIRGFTTLSEKIAPDFLVRILNEYLGEMTDIIFDHNGTLDKFIGDAVMAFWGAPINDEQHARKAVSTALHMTKAVEAFNQRHKKDGYPKLQIGIGVHTGKAIVGNIGSNKRLDYTIIGDNVNLASRLEGLTKEYGVPLLISQQTYDQVKNQFLCRQIDIVVAKGKTQAVSLYQPLAEIRANQDITALEIQSKEFENAFKLYQQGQFSWALESFRKILDSHPNDGPATTYIERCEDLLKSPPQDWQGVYVAKSK